MKIVKPVRRLRCGDALAREDYAELSLIWPDTVNQNFTADLVDVVRTLAYLTISVPLYLLASIALAVALYIRCAGLLLLAD
ncbi:hypothetical protein [Nevskia soli]|uniref:hypothetical protein n=1 Tax=Nevskia soli TaxID=418856 RepID=UPI0014701E53|nr:hypothetical protein [Nevskia soli]